MQRQCHPRLNLTAALVIALLGASSAACDIAMSHMGSAREQATETWTRSYPLSEGGSVDISNVNGKIDVRAGEAGTVEVRAEKIGKGATQEAAKENLRLLQIREDVLPDRVRLDTTFPKMRSGGGEVRYLVRVPRSTRVNLRTVNGGVEVTGVEGGTVVRTTNGGVVGRGLAKRVEAGATNGGVSIDLVRLDDSVDLETTNGGVELTLPSSSKADIVARCTNGGISVSDGLRLETSEKSRRRLEGRLNGGGMRVELKTTNGGVQISGRGAAAVEQ